MSKLFTEYEEDLIGRCISIACWNKRLERYCGKDGDETVVKQCIFIIRSVLSDLLLIIQNHKQGG